MGNGYCLLSLFLINKGTVCPRRSNPVGTELLQFGSCCLFIRYEQLCARLGLEEPAK